MWYYKGVVVNSMNDVPEGAIGMIYKIIRLDTNRYYIGKKQFTSTRKTKITQKEKTETGTRKKFKQVVKESDWQNYNSSCKELQQEIKELGEHLFKKEILLYCFNKRDLTYEEVRYQFLLEVLEKDTYNANILSRFFKKK